MVKDFIEGLRIEIDVNETSLPKIALSDSIFIFPSVIFGIITSSSF